MKTEASYYLILFVYISLWSCQLIACHLTHSLIILTDSYINIYRILDISVGIIHLRTQRQLARQTEPQRNQLLASSKESTLAGKLFDCICTYKYKRLPLLGAFVNGLFLAALLMSAAIEGIQTCFHSGHSGGGHDKSSILMQNELTYPSILIGFALVGIIMQYCSSKAHEMREEELGSDSLLDIRARAANSRPTIEMKTTTSSNNSIIIKELSANNLNQELNDDQPLPELNDNNNKSGKYDLSKKKKSPLSSKKSSLESLQNSMTLKNQHRTSSQISLKSLKFTTNLESLPPNSPPDTPSSVVVNHIPGADLEASRSRDELAHDKKKKPSPHNDRNWFYVRYFASPVALIVDALIVYNISHKEELVVEIADAGLAVLIVVLLFAASYPPMKKAGRVLLQTAPDGVDLIKLEKELGSCAGPQVSRVQELKVWSLTPTSNRVATCQLVLSKELIHSEKQIADILREAKFKFLEQNIKCSTIEPVFGETKPLPDH